MYFSIKQYNKCILYMYITVTSYPSKDLLNCHMIGNQHCYIGHSAAKSWSDAQKECKVLDGTLARDTIDETFLEKMNLEEMWIGGIADGSQQWMWRHEGEIQT